MKAVKISLAVIIFLSVIIGSILPAAAQQSKPAKEAIVKNLIDSQRYIFFAQSASPSSGRLQYLTSEYTVSVTKDTITSDLPYFGRAYSAPINPSEGGIKFTSTDFEYLVSGRKKGGWTINIKPKDKQVVQQLILTVFSDGNASLQVTSTNRQPISFNGHISEKK